MIWISLLIIYMTVGIHFAHNHKEIIAEATIDVLLMVECRINHKIVYVITYVVCVIGWLYLELVLFFDKYNK